MSDSVRVWLWSLAALAGFLVLSYAAVRWVLPLVLPFVLGAVLAEFVNPAVDFLVRGAGRLRVPRALASAVVLLAGAGVLGGLLVLGVTRAVIEIQALVQALPYYYAAVVDLLSRLARELGGVPAALPEALRSFLTRNPEQVQRLLGEVSGALTAILQVFAALPAILTNLLIAFVAAFFLSRDREAMGRFFLGLLPPEARSKVRQAKADVWNTAMGFLKGLFVLVTVTTVLSVTGLTLIGADYALLMGLLVGLADVVPIVGPGAVYLPWAAVEFLSGDGLMALKLVALYAGIVGVRQILEPKVLGEHTGLHPLAILLSMYLGFRLLGGWGFIMGPLIAALLKSVVGSGLLPLFRSPVD
ncbi:sporulation integral membrane protein YtvI [Caldinitratiruptor microaerophilus]|uniref:Sporulation integral membrane protein YtvI n=1 Tax=Caldinitratiruptor microaerophilus TaxID=671077 RepID=A0AA35CJ91_9FIRM|nr:sporulation integral membrane protein YtvI [Caldinitratiruptor microaerophilus]BDG59383.1 sporulation integral membrane protein YtvI [Caldinitratiruptor microaerophilus]